MSINLYVELFESGNTKPVFPNYSWQKVLELSLYKESKGKSRNRSVAMWPSYLKRLSYLRGIFLTIVS